MAFRMAGRSMRSARKARPGSGGTVTWEVTCGVENGRSGGQATAPVSGRPRDARRGPAEYHQAMEARGAHRPAAGRRWPSRTCRTCRRRADWSPGGGAWRAGARCATCPSPSPARRSRTCSAAPADPDAVLDQTDLVAGRPHALLGDAVGQRALPGRGGARAAGGRAPAPGARAGLRPGDDGGGHDRGAGRRRDAHRRRRLRRDAGLLAATTPCATPEGRRTRCSRTGARRRGGTPWPRPARSTSSWRRTCSTSRKTSPT